MDISSYNIEIKTGNHKNSGTDCRVEMKIIGSKNETSFHELNTPLHNDFERGNIDEFTISDVDIGDIEYLSLIVSKNLYDLSEPNWYIDYMFVTKHNQSVLPDEQSTTKNYFPIYQWISKSDHGKEIFISSNKACIPQHETEKRNGCVRNNQTKKNTIEWSPVTFAQGLPGNIKGTDHDWNLNFTDDKDRNFKKNAAEALKNRITRNLVSRLLTIDSIDIFQSFSGNHSKLPEWILNNRWTKDEEFGRQILNGTNPTSITRCRKLPANFNVENRQIASSLYPGTTLEKELKNGNIYIVNHEILQNISTGKYRGKKIELPAAMCLFHVTKEKEFKPIAIQLGQQSDDPIWTPKDDYYDWMLAKMWFKNADVQVHQMNVHLSLTHLIMEPFAIAMFRCLPPVHPIHKLLRESLQFVIAINTVGRSSLIPKVCSTEAFINSYKTLRL